MLNLTAGGLSGGYKKYAQRLVPLLRESPAIADLIVVMPPGYEQLAGSGSNSWSWTPGEHWRGYPALRARVLAWKPDVVLIPTARYLDCGAPVVSMVRNMEPMLPPTLQEGLVAWMKNRVGANMARRASQRSERVIAVSTFVRDYLVQSWHLDAGRVGVVYHGVDVAAPTATRETIPALGNARFVFAAGSLLPYRGLEDAVGALAQIDSDIKLVVAGAGSATYQARIAALAVQLGVSNRLVWLGHVNEQVMNAAFRQCVAFLMTSRVEACPNTALEAMAAGAICISTTLPPMPEFFGDHALYYEATNIAQLAQHIETVARMSPDEQERRSKDVILRAADFEWERTALGTVHQLQLAQGTR